MLRIAGGDTALPTVSVVIPAHNYARFLPEALDSALSQDYPAELVKLIVIDDGSTDDTAAVAQEYVSRHPGRIKLISQENRGYVRTVNRGIEEADGELLGLLDADDAWMPGKLRRQVEMLQAEPELGLVFGDLIAVDQDSVPYSRPTILASMARNHPVPRRAAARILHNNEALESTILVRRSLVTPVPEDLPIADWWITLQAALVSEIDWVREPVVRYRVHGENMSAGQHGGTGQAQRASVHVRDVLWKLRALRKVDLSGLPVPDLGYVWSGVEESALQALNASHSHYIDFTEGVELDEDRALTALSAADHAASIGDWAQEARSVFESLIWNPYSVGTAVRLRAAIKKVEEIEESAAA